MLHPTRDELLDDIAVLGDLLTARGCWFAAAESCTGGLLTATITDVPGVSAWLKGGVTAYHNDVKETLLSTPARVLEDHGAVSEPAVRAMVAGVTRLMEAQAGIAISGVAGPGGGAYHKPVGTVCIAWRLHDETRAVTELISGDRVAVRWGSVARAVRGMVTMVQEQG